MVDIEDIVGFIVWFVVEIVIIMICIGVFVVCFFYKGFIDKFMFCVICLIFGYKK